MDLLHRRAGVLHRDEGLLVDVCGLDGVDLLLEHRDLAVCLLEGVLVLLFPLQCVLGHYPRFKSVSKIDFPYHVSDTPIASNKHQASCLPLRELFQARERYGKEYRFCWLRRCPSQPYPAAPSGSRGASRVSAACRAAAVGRGWLSWGHLSASGLFARRTMSPTCQAVVCGEERDLRNDEISPSPSRGSGEEDREGQMEGFLAGEDFSLGDMTYVPHG